MKKTKKPSQASLRAASPCSASLRVGGTGMTVAYCNLMRGHKGRHAQRYHPASGYGLAGHVSISWPNEELTLRNGAQRNGGSVE